MSKVCAHLRKVNCGVRFPAAANMYGHIAQLAEHAAVNRVVAGSSPAVPAYRTRSIKEINIDLSVDAGSDVWYYTF